MVSPSSRRRAVKQTVEQGLGLAAQACRALELRRSSYYRQSARSERSVELERKIGRMSLEHPRYGYRRVRAMLRRAGEAINAKRVQRVRRAEGLQVRERQKRMKRVGESSSARQRAETLHAVWSWDFVEDQTENGTRFRVLTLIDEYSCVCVATHAAWSIRAVDVITVVAAAMARHGRPGHIRSDNGPEFIAYAIRDWLAAEQVGTIYITPGARGKTRTSRAFTTSCATNA